MREARLPGDLSNTMAPLLICGAGAAGLAAALAAARAGAEVILVEASPRIGGTVVASLIHTLAGLFDSTGRFINQGLPRELAERLARADDCIGPRKVGRAWVLSVCPQIYQATVEEWLASQPRVSVLAETRVVGVHRLEGEIVAVDLVGRQGPLRLRPRSIVDATGTAEVIRCIDPSLVEDGTPTTSGGLILRIRGIVPDAVIFPRNVAALRAIRDAAGEGRLPAACAHAWVDRGFYDDEAYIKLSIPLGEDWRERLGQLECGARQLEGTLLAFLQTLPGFEGASVHQRGAIGVREGGRIRGDYTLMGNDLRGLRRFPDAVCKCAWPIEYWHPEKGVSLEYLPNDDYYEVPMRCLRPQGLANVWVAGKCLSADPEAQASARVVGCCWAMGEAVGIAAATASATNP